MKLLRLAFVGVLLLALGGCAMGRGRCPPPRCALRCAPVTSAPTPAPQPLPAPTSRVYLGATGERASLGAVVDGWQDVDLVVFGELHGNPVGAATELELLKRMAAQGRPVALAMEFLERDTQAAVDAYLAGSLEEADFVKQARQGKAYATSHRPLIEFCKAEGIPVISANAPRKLVSTYRKADDDYATFLEGLSDEERAALPAETSEIDDAYRARFLKLMGPERGPSYFRSQSLWDDAMAEAMADFRDAHPEHRVLFVVGAFHVQSHGGTITKYRLRRADDTVRSIVMAMDNERHLPFDPEEKDTGDVVINVPMPERKAPPKGPNPHEKKKMPPNPHAKKPKADEIS